MLGLLLLLVEVADQFFGSVGVAQSHSYGAALLEDDGLQQFVEFHHSLADYLDVQAADCELLLALLVLLVPVHEITRNSVD